MARVKGPRDWRNKLARAFLDKGLAPDRKTALELADLAFRCGAKTKAGHPCQRRGLLPNLRCCKHGGWSTGALTAEGREAVAEAQRQWRAKRPEKAKIKDDLAKMEAAE